MNINVQRAVAVVSYLMTIVSDLHLLIKTRKMKRNTEPYRTSFAPETTVTSTHDRE
jgi:hypothetical protein